MGYITRSFRFVRARFAPRGARQYFSESGEDAVMLRLLRVLGTNVKDVFYIDIGTHHPIFGNNTYLLYRGGARGVLVEPNKELCEVIKSKRPRDICLNAGIGRVDSEGTFYIFPQTTRSTFSKNQAEEWSKFSGQKYETGVRKVLSLDSIISLCVERVPDIVSIDAEGLDFEILDGFSWKCRPKIFCIENQDVRIGLIMRDRGYKLSGLIFQNAIFVDDLL